MHQVSAIAVRAALDVAVAAGLATDEILADLPFDVRSIGKMKVVAWDDYAVVAERMEAACGSPERLQDLLAEFTRPHGRVLRARCSVHS